MIDVLGLLADRNLRAHSSIVLTYNLDLGLYDGLVRRRLRRSGVVSQTVFCDFTAYQSSLDGISDAPRVGRAYSVTPVRLAGGAFHPKIYLVLGRNTGRLIIGSGNASIGGLIRNAELFGRFDHDDKSGEPPDAAFGACFDLVRELAANAPAPVQRQVERAMAWSPWLSRASGASRRHIVISGPGRTSLLKQVNNALGDREVHEVTVLSASFDRKLSALSALAAKSADGKATCIVQPQVVDIDGASVRRLGDTISWRRFVDPSASQKPVRRDVRVHAKLAVFACADEEVAVYGSANASAPAWLSAENLEVSVVLTSAPPGSTLEGLSLSTNADGESVRDELLAKTWRQEEQHQVWPFALLSAAVSGPKVVIRVDGHLPSGIDLAIARRMGDPKPVVASLIRHDEGLVAEVLVDDTSGRVGSLYRAGKRVSNWVALTWPDVARISSTRWLGAKVESALIAMQDGLVLGTVLFQLLDRVRDFEVVYARSRGVERPTDDDGIGDDDGAETKAFYTDATVDELATTQWVGDRSDLDLLAALVQPLTKMSAHGDDEDDEDDDNALAEEAERRAIDARKGKATGNERFIPGVQPSRRSVEAAVRRLSRRLERAAKSVESTLDERKQIACIPAEALARQIWMTHIGAFLAGRELEASDGSDVASLDTVEFADYVLRVCRAIAGGRHGGLLSLVPDASWEGHDGDSLRAGLAFLWSCVVWATAAVDDYWAHADDDEVANGPCDAAPWLVAARFVNVVRQRCGEPDTADIERRLPGWEAVEAPGIEEWTRRIDQFATFLARVESSDPSTALAVRKTSPRAGDIAFNEGLGVTVIADVSDGGKVHLLNLSRHARCRGAYVQDHVQVIAVPPEVGPLRWREMASG